MNIAVLMTVHNRRIITLTCLRNLFDQALPEGCRFDVYLVDDGCTDGTPDEIRQRFPEVRVIPGDGSLFWNQGMRRAWGAASKGDYDAFLWLNDDTWLRQGAITVLLNTLAKQKTVSGGMGISVGSCRAPIDAGKSDGTEAWTYGGYVNGVPLLPRDSHQKVDRFNGNLVMVSREAFDKVGNLSPAYCHSFGDIDYGIRAAALGVPVWLAPGFLGECKRNPVPKWRNPRVSLLRRLGATRGPKGISASEVKEFTRIRGRGFWLASLIRLYSYAFFPGLASKGIQSLDQVEADSSS